ncbi:hypothetical protein [Tsukamurella soli]|uniref:hypothetical protein n=1 Tax=Tsukamurella soli TaxID=644556 RepID=UPI0031E92CD0
MRHRSRAEAGHAELAVLRVDATAHGRRLTVHWDAGATGDRTEFAHARVFLVVDGIRSYLGVADGPTVTLSLPDGTPGGYVVEVDAYSSGSWGGGHLSGRGRSRPERQDPQVDPPHA